QILGLVYDLVMAILAVADLLLTQRPQLISASRQVADRLSIGRENEVVLHIINGGAMRLACAVRDDYPSSIEASAREFDFVLEPGSKAVLTYSLKPVERGAYQFGKINIRYRSYLGLMWRELKVPAAQEVRVFSDLKAL